LFGEFNDLLTGIPTVRIFQKRVSVPVKGSVGDTVTVTIEGKTFRGIITRIDQVVAVLALT
jgi:hypothetical protein